MKDKMILISQRLNAFFGKKIIFEFFKFFYKDKIVSFLHRRLKLSSLFINKKKMSWKNSDQQYWKA